MNKQNYITKLQQKVEMLKNKTGGKETFLTRVLGFYIKSHKTIYNDEIITLFIYRPLSFILALLFYKLPVSPNFITICRGLTGIIAGILFSQGLANYNFWGAICLFFSNILDCVDGQLARMRGTCSILGKYLDVIADSVTLFALYFGIAWQLSSQNNNGSWWFLAIIATISFLFHMCTYVYYRDELYYYIFPDYNNNQADKLKSEYNKPKSIRMKLFTSIVLGYENIIVFYTEKLFPKIMMPGKYGGFIKWYILNKNIPQKVKDAFKRNYKKKNLFLLACFGMISTLSNISFYIIMGFFNRFDLAIILVCTVFNFYCIILIIIQRLNYNHQLKIALKACKK